MTNIVYMTRQMLAISEDLRNRLSPNNRYDYGYFYDFDQTWGSTSLGFGGVGGDMFVVERTYVFIPQKNVKKAYVYFGGQFAYTADVCKTFKEDMNNRKLVEVAKANRYKFTEEEFAEIAEKEKNNKEVTK